MYLIVIAWTYVTLMMAVAEATSPAGSVLGAVITFLLYGALPMGILVYILGTPSRKRAIKAREAAQQAAHDAQQQQQQEQEQQQAGAAAPPERGIADPSAASTAPDAGSETPAATPGNAVAPVRKEP